MPLLSNFLATLGLLVVFTIGVAPSSARAEQRIALVLGNAAYEAGALKTTANDAGLVAQTLEAAGFEVVGARDLDHDALRRAFRDFLDKAGALGPDDVALLYLGGYGLQLEGENYFVPTDARIERASDVAVQAVRISDYTRALAALKLKVSIVVLDLARSHPFALSGEPVAGGLALVEPEPGMLIAFNAAPGTIAPAAQGSYGTYAQALAEMMREGGLPLEAVFDRVRLRVSDGTQGAQVPWHASNVTASFVFFERTADAPSVAASEPSRWRHIRDFSAQGAYVAVLERDTLPDYLEFLDTYPNDPLANRVRAIVAARREALTWRRTRQLDTPAAYWSYLRLYRDGPHVGDCYRRLAFLHASLEPPVDFSVVDYDVPPPPPEELIYVRQLVIFFGDPSYDLPLPPPIPASFLPPPAPEFIELLPPPPPPEPFMLPAPVYTPVPDWVRPPDYVQPPPANNVIFANIHNKVVIDRAGNTFTVTERGGHTRTLQAPPVFRHDDQRHAGARGQLPRSDTRVGPALPPSLAHLAARTDGATNRPRRERPERAQREDRPGLPLPPATEPRPRRAPSGPTAATRQFSPQQPAQPQVTPPLTDRPQRQLDGVARGGPQRAQPLITPGEPLPKALPAPPRTATVATPPAAPPAREPGLWRGRPQSQGAGTPSAALPRPPQSAAQPSQPTRQAAPQPPAAAALRSQDPTPPARALPKALPPSVTQAAPAGQPHTARATARPAAATSSTTCAARASGSISSSAAANSGSRAPSRRRGNRSPAAASRTGRSNRSPATASRTGRGCRSPTAASRTGRGSRSPAAASRTGRGSRSPAAASRTGRGRRSPAAASRTGRGRRSPATASRTGRGRRSPAAASRTGRGSRSPAAASRTGRSSRSPATASRTGRGRRSPTAASRTGRGRRSPATASRTGRGSGACLTSCRCCSCPTCSGEAALAWWIGCNSTSEGLMQELTKA